MSVEFVTEEKVDRSIVDAIDMEKGQTGVVVEGSFTYEGTPVIRDCDGDLQMLNSSNGWSRAKLEGIRVRLCDFELREAKK